MASLTWAGLTAGSHSITAVYSGDAADQGSTSAPLVQTVTKAATTMAVTSSASPAVYGQAVTFTATVSLGGAGSTDIPYPTGTVTFSDGNTTLGFPVTLKTVNGVSSATLTWSGMSVGAAHSIQAIYHGSSNVAASSGTMTQVVNPDATVTVIGASAGTVSLGQAVTLTASVQAAAPGSGTPTGTVKFIDATTGTVLGSVSLSGGVATLKTTALPLGSQLITATFAGSSSFLGGSTLVGVSVAVTGSASEVATKTSVTSSATPSVYGQSVLFTATVAAVGSGAQGSPTGTVEFFDGTAPMGAPVPVSTTGGVTTATLSYGGLPVSSGNAIKAVYSGDSQYNASSGAMTQPVNPAATTTVLTDSAATIDFGLVETFTVRVSATSPGSGIPTGTVNFREATTGIDLGTVALSGGVATMTTTMLTAGSQAVTATYGGATSFLAGIAATATVAVVPSIYALDPTAAGAIQVNDGATITTPGLVQVDSNSPDAIVAGGDGQVNAAKIQVVGGVSVTVGAALDPSPTTGATSIPDPLASLPVPAPGASLGAVDLTGDDTMTIAPGVYSAIGVSGNAVLTLEPGVYVLDGGGLSVTGHASVSGTGVLIYNAGTDYSGGPAGGGSGGPVGSPGSTPVFGAITIAETATVQLTAATTGTYAGVTIFQARNNTQPITVGGTTIDGLGTTIDGLGGTLYAPVATLSVAEAHWTLTSLVVNQVQVTGTGTIGTVFGLASIVRGPMSVIAAARPSNQGGAVNGGIWTSSLGSSPTAMVARSSTGSGLTTAAAARSSQSRSIGLGGASSPTSSSDLLDADLLNELAIGVIGSQDGSTSSDKAKAIAPQQDSSGQTA